MTCNSRPFYGPDDPVEGKSAPRSDAYPTWARMRGAADLHALLEIVDRGYPPHLAARILAPLDPDTP